MAGGFRGLTLAFLALGALVMARPLLAQEEDTSDDPIEQSAPREQKIISVTGRVLMEDGGPPSEPVTIERICPGYSLTEGYTDRKGQFSFQIHSGSETSSDFLRGSVPSAASSGAAPDTSTGMRMASQSNHLFRLDADASLRDCRLEASLSGYRTAAVEFGGRDFGDMWKLGTLVLRRLANVEGTSISFTTLAAPKKARQSFDKAFKELRRKKPNEAKAGRELESAVGEYPKFAAAWNLLGQCRLRADDRPGAREAFEKSIEIDPKYIAPYLPLMRMAVHDGAWRPANELAIVVLKLNPFITEARYLSAISHFGLGEFVEAEQAARLVLQAQDAGRFPQNHYLLGTIYTSRKDYPSAANHLRAYLASQPPTPATDEVRRRLREWEMLGVIPPDSETPAPRVDRRLAGRMER